MKKIQDNRWSTRSRQYDNNSFPILDYYWTSNHLTSIIFRFRNSNIQNTGDTFKASFDLKANDNGVEYELYPLEFISDLIWNSKFLLNFYFYSLWWIDKVEKNEQILKIYLNPDNVRKFTKRDFRNVKEVKLMCLLFRNITNYQTRSNSALKLKIEYLELEI